MMTALLFLFAATLAVLNLMGHIAISWWWIALVFPGMHIIVLSLTALLGWLVVSIFRRNDPQYRARKTM